MKIAFHTFGCKLNQVETEAIADRFIRKGWIISNNDDADLFFVNTCAVTRKAEAKGRRLIRQLTIENPGKVVAAGCFAQLKPKEISELGELKYVLGTKDKFGIFDLLSKDTDNLNEDAASADSLVCSGNNFRSRVFLKIQDGCDHGCSYCIVPKLRGDSVSAHHEVIYKAAESAVSNGPNEIVLSGVDIGSYTDKDGWDLADILTSLVQIPDIFRLRLSSVEPPGFNEKLLEAIEASDKICHHFHVPLQSGSDRILKLMRRGYTRHEYFDLVDNIAHRFPDARMGTDVIVGFPGEGEEDFQQTAELVQNSPITHIHVFPFSPRPGTEYGDIDDISPKTKAERANLLRRMVNAKNTEFIRKNIGRTATVLFEGDGNRGGLTDNYIRVFSENGVKAGFASVRLSSTKNNRVYGQLI